MKKIICITLIVAIILGIIPVSAVAENSTGLIWDTWEDIVKYAVNSDSGLDIYEMSVHRKGDINGDGQIRVSDARLCLRAAVNLESLSEVQKKAADVLEKGEITSATARQILRISAGLDEQIANSIEMTTDWGFIFGSLRPAGSGMYTWYCTADDGLTVTQTWRYDRVVNPGDTSDLFFIFSAEKAGTYNAHFELRSSWEDVPIDSFDVRIVVKQ